MEVVVVDVVVVAVAGEVAGEVVIRDYTETRRMSGGKWRRCDGGCLLAGRPSGVTAAPPSPLPSSNASWIVFCVVVGVHA